MANEVTINCSLDYSDANGVERSLSVVNFLKTVASKIITEHVLTVTTTEVAIPLGSIATPGYGLFINLDATNFVELRVSSGGARDARLDASGGLCLKRFGSGAATPYIIADTATCLVHYLLISI